MILVISKDRTAAISISDIFRRMGVLSCAVSAAEIHKEPSERYSAVIIHDPDRISALKEHIDRFKAFGITVYALGKDISEQTRSYPIEIIPHAVSSATALKQITSTAYDRSERIPGFYRLGGIDASCDQPTVTYWDKPVPLTSKETMILRAIIRAYPNPISAEKILKMVFKPNTTPTTACIRTHISSINRKLKQVCGQGLITLQPGKGYTIETALSTSAKNK